MLRKAVVQRIQAIVGDYPDVARQAGCSAWLFSHTRTAAELATMTERERERGGMLLHPASEQALGMLSDELLLDYLIVLVVRYTHAADGSPEGPDPD